MSFLSTNPHKEKKNNLLGEQFVLQLNKFFNTEILLNKKRVYSLGIRKGTGIFHGFLDTAAFLLD